MKTMDRMERSASPAQVMSLGGGRVELFGSEVLRTVSGVDVVMTICGKFVKDSRGGVPRSGLHDHFRERMSVGLCDDVGHRRVAEDPMFSAELKHGDVDRASSRGVASSSRDCE